MGRRWVRFDKAEEELQGVGKRENGRECRSVFTLKGSDNVAGWMALLSPRRTATVTLRSTLSVWSATALGMCWKQPLRRLVVLYRIERRRLCPLAGRAPSDRLEPRGGGAAHRWLAGIVAR